MTALPHDIHDLGYKSLFSFGKIFQQLIEGYVDQEWKDRLDYSRSERLDKTFISKRFEKRESDILYKVPLKGEEGKEVYLYVLIEHQSKVDFSLAFRVLVYLVEIWKTICKNTPRKLRRQKAFRLPPVFPIVLYNGKESWTAATSVKELVDQGEVFGDFLPNVHYHLVNVPRLDKDKLKAIGNSLVGVFLLEHQTTIEEFEKLLKDALKLIYNEKDEEMVRAVIEWVCMCLRRRFPEKTAEDYIEHIDATKQGKEEVRTMLETMPEKIFTAGQQRTIVAVLEARFGEITEEIKHALGTVTRNKVLEGLAKKAATAKSLEQFQLALNKIAKKRKEED